MRLNSLSSTIILTLTLAIGVSCSTTSKSTDLKEYGYNGPVKSIVSSMYTNLEKENGEWEIDPSKLDQVTTVTFNKVGNMLEVATQFPNQEEPSETLVYSYEDDVKTGFVRVDESGNTLNSGVYTWIDEFNYELDIQLDEEAKLHTTSKLNENYRDLSGSTTYIKNDSVLFTRSYTNTINDKNLLTRTDFFDKETKEKTSNLAKYFELDEYGNPCKIVITDSETGELKQLMTRKFEYFK